ncbi:Endoribonuclease Dicer-like protein 3 [Forsythia ovata]|uniref:Endoribonuclease Dicer-like protein 3 n=1 Tax=Forsythia ovata TaxID=205694 RepID=A0ABD1WJD5_9LAMI
MGLHNSYQASDLVKLDILLNGQPADAMATIRLEFLGDSVLDILVTWRLYRSYPNVDPGELTYLCAASVLEDLVESIAGAMLIDTNLDLHKVWKVFKPLLSPKGTPDNLELPPCRELIELCDSLGYFIKSTIH